VRLAHHLIIRDGQDCVAPAEEYSTPLYVTSEDMVLEQSGSYKKLPGPATRQCRCSSGKRRLDSCQGQRHSGDLTTAAELPLWQA
jgi:hypothetical protein